MRVKLVKLNKHYLNDQTVTVGNIYNTDRIDQEGDVQIIDDLGVTSYLFKGEFEVIEE